MSTRTPWSLVGSQALRITGRTSCLLWWELRWLEMAINWHGNHHHHCTTWGQNLVIRSINKSFTIVDINGITKKQKASHLWTSHHQHHQKHHSCGRRINNITKKKKKHHKVIFLYLTSEQSTNVKVALAVCHACLSRRSQVVEPHSVTV